MHLLATKYALETAKYRNRNDTTYDSAYLRHFGKSAGSKTFYTLHWLEVFAHLCHIKTQGDAARDQGETLSQQWTNPSVLTSPAMAESPPPVH
ncbi:hypothetical protein Q8A67_023870 [Cirrhinus molitorella]|uniref:Uncharacterized protein n=1 Tax=Cirrhinus molitorella TaxID=172907 RepID=A0AA88TEN3_9TELE|nr:hypothetical protein Q8A67_023870 [Cirrhinus molitorella]